MHYYANKQQTFDAVWDYFTKLPMITCYDLMFYEPSTSFLTSLLWYKHFQSTFLKNICRFGNFITACMQKTQNKSGHSPSTRQNILILHQNPLQHPISALSASHVIIYCGLIRYGKSRRSITDTVRRGGTGFSEYIFLVIIMHDCC